LPLIGIIINNFDAFKESNSMLEDELISLTRDCQRYGIFFVLAANNDHSVRIKLKQNFNAIFTLRFNDLTDYGMVLGRTKIIPKEIAGRGLFKEKRVYEFQTAHITDEQSLNEYINNIGSKLQQTNQFKAKAIPSMPEVVTIDFVREYLNGLEDVPIGVYESTLDIVKYNFTSNLLTPIISEKINNITDFSKGLITELSQIKNTQLIVIDTESLIEEIKNTTKYYYSKEPEKIIEVLINYVQQIKMINNNELKAIIYINYFSKFVEQVSKNKIEEFVNLLKETKGISLIITDEHKGIKNLSFDGWYRNIQNDSSGIWIGSGIIEQSVFKTSRLPRGVKNILQKNYGFIIDGDNVELFKTIECDKKAGDLND